VANDGPPPSAKPTPTPKPSPKVQVREAQPRDADDLVALIGLLGHDVDGPGLRKRLAALKKNGLPVPNITRAIESNLRSRPPLMVQKKKMGTTRQARKQYALTQEGVDFVESKLRTS